VRGVLAPDEGVDIEGGAATINLLNLELLIIHLQDLLYLPPLLQDPVRLCHVTPTVGTSCAAPVECCGRNDE
jgi:hypothetical protein